MVSMTFSTGLTAGLGILWAGDFHPWLEIGLNPTENQSLFIGLWEAQFTLG